MSSEAVLVLRRRRFNWTVEEEGSTVAVRPRHIAILLRRFRQFRTDVTRAYVRALEARRIPHVLVGGRSFHDREEVIALRDLPASSRRTAGHERGLRGPFARLGYLERLGRMGRYLRPPAPGRAAGRTAGLLRLLGRLLGTRHRRKLTAKQ